MRLFGRDAFRQGFWRGVDAAMRAVCTCNWMTPHAAMVACVFDFQVIYHRDPKCPWHSRAIAICSKERAA